MSNSSSNLFSSVSFASKFCLQNGRRPLLQLLHPNSSRYFSHDDLASLDLSVPSLCSMVWWYILPTIFSIKMLEFFILMDFYWIWNLSNFSTQFQDKSETSSQTKDTDGNESGEETKDEQEDTLTEHTDHEENIKAAGGKKDPLVRRQELLVNSGLAEVCVTWWLSFQFLDCFLIQCFNFSCITSYGSFLIWWTEAYWCVRGERRGIPQVKLWQRGLVWGTKICFLTSFVGF